MGQERTSSIISKCKPLAGKHQDYPRKHSLDLSKFRADDFAGMQEVLDSCARNISELQVLIDSLSYLVRTDLFTPSSIYDFQAMRLPEL